MDTRELVTILCDEFHDWTDGDDSVVEYSRVGSNSIDVTFDDGSRFSITITEIK